MSTAREAPLRPTYAEINLGAFDRNLLAVRARLPDDSRLIAVLKANGYGHGARQLAERCVRGGASMIAVAILEEALELHDARVELPILLLGPVTPLQLPIAVERGFVLGIVGPRHLSEVARYTTTSGLRARIHLKLDSGMGRMGLVESELAEAAAELHRGSNLSLEAIYTHFANASDPDDPHTEQQLARFDRMLATLRQAGIEAPLHHTANSAAVMRGLVRAGDYARVGLSLLGGEPLDKGTSRLEPVMRWRTEIARLKNLSPGSGVGYGLTFKTSRPSRIATLPVGYADGYDRRMSNRGEVLVRGKRAPVVGRVSMDLVTVDVTEIDGASEGDEVTLLGRDAGEEISAEEIAGKTGTIAYEVFCRVSTRVPRVYER